MFGKLLKIVYFKIYPTEEKLISQLKSKKFKSESITYQQFDVTNNYFERFSDNMSQSKFKEHSDFVKHIRYKNIEGAILHSPGTSFSIFISFISLILPALIQPDVPLCEITKLKICGLLISILSFVSLAPYLRQYVMQLPLDDYVVFIKNIYTESEMISFISYRIWKVSNEFDNATQWMNNSYYETKFNQNSSSIWVKKFLIGRTKEGELEPGLIGGNENYGWPDLRKGQKFIKSSNSYGISRLATIKNNLMQIVNGKVVENKDSRNNIRRLQYKINELEKQIQQISELMKCCSERLRIHEVELAEHFFQFSPSMYWAWIKKVSHNLDTCLDLFYNADFSNKFAGAGTSEYLYDQLRLFYTKRIGS
ncbi:MAG: hypothetical protein IPN13_06295 [Bacteroidetes bacterium]|nr:hypothetical protein [Bacteroidota bacterium]